MVLNLKENKEKFIQIFKNEIKRDGAEQLLAWIESSDFFTAPLSSQYTLSVPGGLCIHAIHTYRAMAEIIEKYRQSEPDFLLDLEEGATEEDRQIALAQLDESIAVIGLLSSICLADCWVEATRNEQQPDGKWKKVPTNKWDEKFMYGGRGIKSVFIIQQFMHVYVEEAQAIRFHLQGRELPFGDSFDSSYQQVYDICPIAAVTGAAVNEATYILDKILWQKLKKERV